MTPGAAQGDERGGGPTGPPPRASSDRAGDRAAPDARASEARAAAWAPMDAGVRAYRAGRVDAVVTVRTDVAEDEPFDVALLFREGVALDDADRLVLGAAVGRVLDVGAGVGALAVPLVRAGHDVTALEVLPSAVDVLRARGVDDARPGGLEALEPGERFDTVVVLMNGVGLAGSVGALPSFLEGLAQALAPGGALYLDSTDPGGWGAPDDGRHAGEVHMQLAFDGLEGPPFPYLFADAGTVLGAAAEVGLAGRAVATWPGGRFLLRLERG